jgi:hypothetical protein
VKAGAATHISLDISSAPLDVFGAAFIKHDWMLIVLDKSSTKNIQWCTVFIQKT